jgi:20S proteasome subunit alpha 5
MRTGLSCKCWNFASASDIANFRFFFIRYHAEPSGTFYRYDAKAIGSGSEGAQAELQNEYHRSLTLAEAETLVLKTLKQVMEEKLDSKNVQLASVTKEKGFRIYNDEEMGQAVTQLGGNQ